jgi:uncharacterized protein YkwD
VSSRRRRAIFPVLPVLVALTALLVVLGGGLAIEHFLADGRPVALSQQPSSPAPRTPDASDSASPPTASPSPSKTHRKHRVTVKKTAVSPSPTRSTTSSAVSRESAAAVQVVRLTNLQRVQHGCAPLRVDARLTEAAQAHSADMDRRHYFDHDSPDGRTPWARIKATGYQQPGAENIAMGQPTPVAVVGAWMNSPGHRANILNCDLKAIGVGVQYDTAGGPWWTQDFGWI